MALKIAQRGAVAPFIVMDVLRAANARVQRGESVVHMEVGQPGTAAPAGVLEAARTAIVNDRLGYTDACGIEALRRRIAQHYADQYGVDVDWRRIVITTGSSGAFLLAFLSAFDVGDRVVVSSPGYPAYRNILEALGIEVVNLEVGADTNYQPTPALLDTLPDPLSGLIAASPANPTGTMLHREELAALITYARDRGMRFISDEIYHGITYGREAETILTWTADAIVVNSFSKYYSMTGWRLGWMVVPEAMSRPIECLAQNFFISPPALSQHAALAAFDCRDELDTNVARYGRSRALLLDALPKLGFDRLAAAEGAFYIYADVAAITNDSQAFCQRMLSETGVATTPGIDFDPERGRRFVRFSFAGEEGEVVEALSRLRGWRF